MKALSVYARLYADCLASALKGIGRNAWTLLLPIALLFAWVFLALPLVASLGRIGGFVVGFLIAAFFSCYLYFTSEIVASSRVSLKEFRTSIGAYFWSVVNLLFVLWILSLVLGLVVGGVANGGLIVTGIWLLVAIVLNPAPETIYERGTRNGLETVQSCLHFIQEQWIEWFVPNLLLLAAAWAYVNVVLPVLPPVLELVGIVVGGALFHVAMVFRGHLFKALDGSSHRQRMFRYRNASA